MPYGYAIINEQEGERSHALLSNTPTNSRKSWKKKGYLMRLMAKRGVILAVGLSALWVVLAHPAGDVRFPSNIPTEIVRAKASWEEKDENRKIAKTYAWVGYGWRNEQATCLIKLWTRESRFDHYAQNPESSAFGIAQLLGEKSRDPRLQILRGLRYIGERYGTPCKAYKFALTHKHY